MKIIIVGNNYAERPELRTDTPLISFKPDSALVRDGKPFFLPDFSTRIEYELSVVVRVDRLGKCISPKFAHRYYQEVTVGIDWTAHDLQEQLQQQGWSWELSKCFDNSAALGEFVPLSEVGGDIQHLPFRLDIDGQTVLQGDTAQMNHRVDDPLAYISRYMTLKMGDLLYTGSPSAGSATIGQHLEGYLAGRKLLDFHVR